MGQLRDARTFDCPNQTTARRHHRGEPCLQPALVTLIERLNLAKLHVTVETAGTVYLPMACDLISISPKLANSTPKSKSISAKWIALHEQRRWRPEVIEQLVHDARAWQLKFVVDEPQDCSDLLAHVEALQPRLPNIQEHVWIMPQARDGETLREKQAWLKPWCDSQGFRYCERWQLLWYGDRRGT